MKINKLKLTSVFLLAIVLFLNIFFIKFKWNKDAQFMIIMIIIILIIIISYIYNKILKNYFSFRDIKNIFNYFTNDSIIILDLDYNILFWNKISEDMLGYSKKEVIGKNFNKYIKNNILKDKDKYKLGNFKDSIEINIKNKNLNVFWSSILIRSNVYIILVIHDITIRKKKDKFFKKTYKELELKTQELKDQNTAILNVLEDIKIEKDKKELISNNLKKYKLAVDNESDQVIITNPNGTVIYVNKSFEKTTGFKLEEILNKKAGSLWKLPMSKNYYKKLWDTIKINKKVFIGEIKNRKKNGDMYDALISISPVLNNENKILYFVAIEHDITKEKEIDKAKTEFVSLASHQLRTPLSGINWYIEMLLNEDAGKINNLQREYLNDVLDGSKKMVELVNSLLNISRLDMGKITVELESLNIIDLTKEIILELKPQIINKKIKLSEIYNVNTTEFKADKKLLKMVLQNLLTNAIKYTEMKGLLKISIENKKKDEVFGGKILKEDSLTIFVADFGMGIPINQQDQIFLKLFRADNARVSDTTGTGLGLYIVKSIVDRSGGRVWFKSKENIGTTFYISFPNTGMINKNDKKSV